MNEKRVNKQKLLDSLPGEWPDDKLLAGIQQRLRADGGKVVVLDDDPTGTQTVHGVAVLTEWSIEALGNELDNSAPAFYVLTNSRSLPLNDAQKLNAEIGYNLVQASRLAGCNFVVVSRSDSTLRGHFPGEVDALSDALRQKFDARLIIPFFLEGGRYTINDIHYVAEGDELVPAGQTEFARDASFGYKSSNLCEWVEEKTNRRISAAKVKSIPLEDIRRFGPQRVTERLMALTGDCVCIVNAASYRDLEVFTVGLLAAEALGKRFLYRTAASIVQVRAGINPRSLLTRDDMKLPDSGGGLIVIGSYVPRTTGQIKPLLDHSSITGIEVDVQALLDEQRYSEQIAQVTEQADQVLSRGGDVALFTSRRLVTGTDAESSLLVGQRVSTALVEVASSIHTRPRYILAKGGITSSDVATKGLRVKRAEVLGQILPGVPVWRLGPESRHPGMSYIVFPGNVGGPNALVDIVEALQK